MIRRGVAFLSLSLVFAGTAGAQEGELEAQYLWVTETSVQTVCRAQLGLGLLDSPGLTGGRGAAITNYFGVDYALNPDLGVSIGLPLAGTLSAGTDDFGIGNVVLGAKYLTPLDRFRVAIGANLALPTAQSGAIFGRSARQIVQFVDDQLALSPYLAISYVRDRLTLSVDLGTDLQIFTESAAGRGRIENIIFYDVGAAMSIDRGFWGTIEMGGYSTVSYSDKNTELYAGPGVRWQDYELSIGLHLWAPFRKPATGVIDFMVTGDFRVLF